MKIETFEKAQGLVHELSSLERRIEALSGMSTDATTALFQDSSPCESLTHYFNPATEEDNGQLEERRVIIEDAIEAFIKSYKEEQAELMAALEAL